MKFRSLVVAIACTAPGARAQSLGVSTAPHPPGNVLLIVADDVGSDMIGMFGQHPAAAPTPTLDALAANGVAFMSAYTDPVCSPTRACILTGRYGFRTGMGNAILPGVVDFSLPHSEVTIPERLTAASRWHIENSAVGKWHLSAPPANVALEPNLQGFDWFSGMPGNLYLGQTYYAHTKIENGISLSSTTYVTTEQVDDAIARTQSMREPWFLYLAFNAGHAPWHVPPANLHSYALSGAPNASAPEHYRASVEALDTELGRLFASMDAAVLARTTIFFIGDNGAPNEALLPPSIPGQSKGTLYEGGIHVPLIVSGHRVQHPGSRCYSLVNSVDLFPTVLDLFDTPPSDGTLRTLDGVSMMPYLVQPWCAPQRDWVYCGKFTPNGFGPYVAQGRMLRSARWKLIERDGQVDALYDMASAQGEQVSVYGPAMTQEQQAAYGRCKKWMRGLVAP